MFSHDRNRLTRRTRSSARRPWRPRQAVRNRPTRRTHTSTCRGHNKPNRIGGSSRNILVLAPTSGHNRSKQIGDPRRPHIGLPAMAVGRNGCEPVDTGQNGVQPWLERFSGPFSRRRRASLARAIFRPVFAKAACEFGSSERISVQTCPKRISGMPSDARFRPFCTLQRSLEPETHVAFSKITSRFARDISARPPAAPPLRMHARASRQPHQPIDHGGLDAAGGLTARCSRRTRRATQPEHSPREPPTRAGHMSGCLQWLRAAMAASRQPPPAPRLAARTDASPAKVVAQGGCAARRANKNTVATISGPFNPLFWLQPYVLRNRPPAAPVDPGTPARRASCAGCPIRCWSSSGLPVTPARPPAAPVDPGPAARLPGPRQLARSAARLSRAAPPAHCCGPPGDHGRPRRSPPARARPSPPTFPWRPSSGPSWPASRPAWQPSRPPSRAHCGPRRRRPSRAPS